MQKILNSSDLTNEIAVVVGTRPGIIKFSPVIQTLQEVGHRFFIVHTGQHYSYNMDKTFFEDLDLPAPRFYNEGVSKETYHGAQTALMIIGVEQALLEAKPGIVIVGGDANTNLAAAIATRKLGIKLAHMEAGLRSHDWSMPEEHNRVMIDHISELLFTPTAETRKNLVEDHVRGEIYVVGNSIVDAVIRNKEIAEAKSTILNQLSLKSRGYSLLTVHREENLDNDETLEKIVGSIEAVSHHFGDLPLIFPIHPRTEKRLRHKKYYEKMASIPNLQIIPPVGYIDFLKLLRHCEVVLTDSGGIQEEACELRVPCVTLRENTERPETTAVGANMVAGTMAENVVRAVKEMLQRPTTWENPIGDGKTSQRIVEKLIENL